MDNWADNLVKILIFILLISKNAAKMGQENDFMRIITEFNGNRSSTSKQAPLPKVHLIRIPKASSSSISAIARRLVGCNPPGPCCRYPGNPKGSCPAPRDQPDLLFKCSAKVVGCTHHYPHLEELERPRESRPVSLSMMREPISRSLSAFSYVPPHSNRKGVCLKSYSEHCFYQYSNNSVWQNIAVKMLSGAYSYAPVHVCKKPSQCRNNLRAALENLDKLTFMGITELWEVSILVLYARLPSLKPQVEDFSPYAVVGGGAVGTRHNLNQDYALFKKRALAIYASPLNKQNSLDIELYRAALKRLCREVHDLGMWSHAIVRESWTTGVPKGYGEAAPECITA